MCRLVAPSSLTCGFLICTCCSARRLPFKLDESVWFLSLRPSATQNASWHGCPGVCGRHGNTCGTVRRRRRVLTSVTRWQSSGAAAIIHNNYPLTRPSSPLSSPSSVFLLNSSVFSSVKSCFQGERLMFLSSVKFVQKKRELTPTEETI